MPPTTASSTRPSPSAAGRPASRSACDGQHGLRRLQLRGDACGDRRLRPVRRHPWAAGGAPRAPRGSPMDLSPRLQPPVPARRRKRPWPAMFVLALVLVAGGIVVTKFLTSAIDYYCNVDEIGVKTGCEPGRSLRVQGTVEKGTIVQQGGETAFRIAFHGKAL